MFRNIKNYNNGLGLPLTVLNLASDNSYDLAVLEMGMSTPMNEITRLCRITPPDVAVVLNVLPVHVEHLGSIENVAKAKAEIVEGMKAGGTAVLNADDQGAGAGDAVTEQSANDHFRLSTEADVRAEDVRLTRFGATGFTLAHGCMMLSHVRLNGKHNILNALAAAAVGVSFGMKVGEIASALSTVGPPPQRGEVLHFAEGFTVINDSYNSNPAALLSMVDTLVEGGGRGSTDRCGRDARAWRRGGCDPPGDGRTDRTADVDVLMAFAVSQRSWSSAAERRAVRSYFPLILMKLPNSWSRSSGPAMLFW